jgi:hypothetical protein
MTNSTEQQILEHMRLTAIHARLRHPGKPYPEADRFIELVEDEIYFRGLRELEARKDKAREELHASKSDSDSRDNLLTLKVGSRLTTFRINGKPATLGEFRKAAKQKGIDVEKRLKLSDQPERFISRGEVRAEPGQ